MWLALSPWLRTWPTAAVAVVLSGLLLWAAVRVGREGLCGLIVGLAGAVAGGFATLAWLGGMASIEWWSLAWDLRPLARLVRAHLALARLCDRLGARSGTVTLVVLGVAAIGCGLFALRRSGPRVSRALALAALIAGAACVLLAPGPRVAERLKKLHELLYAPVHASPNAPADAQEAYYADRLLNLGRLDEALVHYRIARRLDRDGNPDYPLAEGMILLAQGRPEEADRYLTDAWQLRGHCSRIDEYEAMRLAGSERSGSPWSKPRPQRSKQDLADERLMLVGLFYAAGLVSLERWGDTAEVVEELLRTEPRWWDGHELLQLAQTAAGQQRRLPREAEAAERQAPEQARRLQKALAAGSAAGPAREALHRWAGELIATFISLE